MPINFPNSPINGTSYTYQGIVHTFVKPTAALGHWAISTPGSIGVSTGTEIDAGTDTIKYVTPAGIKASKLVEEDIDGSTKLNHSGTQRLETSTTGVEVGGSNLTLINPATSGAALNLLNSEGGIRLAADNAGFTIQDDPFGTSKTWISGVVDGGVTLNHNGSTRLSTTLGGANVNGDLVVSGTLDSGALTVDGDLTVSNGRIKATNSVISGHTRAGNMQLVDGSFGSSTGQSVMSNSTERRWRSYGPTGSGAEEEWSMLNFMPNNASIVILEVQLAIGAVNNVECLAQFFATRADIVIANASQPFFTRRAELRHLGDTGTTGADLILQVYVPVDDANMFQVNYVEENTNAQVIIRYQGFIADEF